MIKITFATKLPKTYDAHVVFSSTDKKTRPAFAALDKVTKKALSTSVAAQGFKSKRRTSQRFIGHDKAPNVMVMGLGKTADLKILDIEGLGSDTFKAFKSSKVKKLVVEVDTLKKITPEKFAATFGYGALLNSYTFNKYKSQDEKKDKTDLKEIVIVCENTAAAKKEFATLQAIAEGVFLTRDLVCEPANELYPESFAKRAKKELSKLGVKITILNEKQMKKLGMNSLLSVGHGSARESHLCIMEWKGAPKSAKQQPIALVGKGITFDTGGISLKPGAGMWDMKWDMGGAGAVVGAMKAIAGRKAKANVIGVIALAENMPSERATRPGDVVTSMSGQTIEILNTDAEGRLVLADALTYVQQKYKPEEIIDLATLTGAIIVALGHEFAGAYTHTDGFADRIRSAGTVVGDEVWHMPMTKAWDKAMDSEIADIRNISMGRDAGSATAAAFLSRFVEDGQKWLHLDIAGMAWSKKDQDARPKGATGYGVRLLDQYIRDEREV